MADPRPSTIPYPSTRNENLSSRDPPRLQNIAASLANPATSTRGVNRRRRGKFSVLPELLSRKSFLSHFSPPTSFPPPLFRPAIRGFRRLRETCSIPGREYDTTGARLGIRDPARKKSTGMLFALGFLSPVFPSLSLSLASLFFEREEERWMLASFFFSLSLSHPSLPLFPSSSSYFECEPLTREIRGNRGAENGRCVRLVCE